MKARLHATKILVLAVVPLVLTAGGASANDPVGVVNQVVARATAHLEQTAPGAAATATDALLVHNGALADTSLPRDPSAAIVMPSTTGTPFTFRIPATSSALLQGKPGTAVYRGTGDDSYLAVQPLSDRSVRTLITLLSPRAPRSYAFVLGVPAGGYLSPLGDGSVEVVGAHGETLAMIASPWAVDADGNYVKTSFAIHGDTLVQMIEPSSGVTYPIVADPWVQGDCGIITCTVRLDRASTRNARDAGWLIGAAGGACGAVTAGTTAIVCAAAIAPAAVALAVVAGRYYENGNCLGIRFYPLPPQGAAFPTQVKRNTYNCR